MMNTRRFALVLRLLDVTGRKGGMTGGSWWRLCKQKMCREVQDYSMSEQGYFGMIRFISPPIGSMGAFVPWTQAN